jgi:2-hydroxy-3-keto-5-methylthiopentenyl-1-phosphate phosphatase
MSTNTYFVDFDGTITGEDSLDLLFERFADPRWRENDLRWEQGKIGSRENLEGTFASFSLSFSQLDELIDELTVDTTFVDFLNWTSQNGHRCIIVSEGLDYIIRGTLVRKLLLTENQLCNLAVHAGLVESNGAVVYPPVQPCLLLAECRQCGICKYDLVSSVCGRPKIYIGDGLSDRFGIRLCDRVYAKNRLESFCVSANFNHVSFRRFADIIAFERDLAHNDESM